eukprot:4639119-Pleurochrysis_carterae.AAC.1
MCARIASVAAARTRSTTPASTGRVSSPRAALAQLRQRLSFDFLHSPKSVALAQGSSSVAAAG